jgi:Transglycosylase SLT domain/SPOR domain
MILHRFHHLRLPGKSAGLLLLAVLFASPAWAERSLVQVPVKFDYPLLHQLLVRQMFNKEGGTAEILHDSSGCNRIVLSDPRLTPRGDQLEIITAVDAKLGVPFLGGCNELLAWQGGAGFLGKPRVQPGGTAVSFEPSATWLVGPDGSRTTSGPLWDMAENSVLAFFAAFTLDLAPYIDSLGDLLPDVLPHRSTQQLQSIVSSLKLGEIQVAPASLNATINFEIDALEEQPRAEAALSAEELQQWETRWQLMDAVLVMAVKRYAAATGLQELRDALLEILIDSRYRLRDALSSPPDRANDAVRSWFVDSWQHLSPVIRSIALEQPGQEQLLWLSVLSATDALDALDQLGPGIGLDISADGLKRLARMINDNQAGDVLRYSEEVDPELQQLFEQQLPPQAAPPAAMHFNFSLLPRAYAAAPTNKLNRWVPDKDELGEYLPQIARLLDDSYTRLVNKYPLQQEHKRLFKNLVLATAWQESCWRQYVVTNKRIEPLRSGSGDVGLMQVNEKVWRGFYDIQKLRWDINYNSDAGARILLDYLVKYALKQGEQTHSGGQANLARASYSAYNGGPSQVSRYRRGNVPAAHKKIDDAFWQKYRQVEAGNEMGVAKCLGGEAAIVNKTAAPRPSAAKPAVAADPAKGWVLAQKEQYYTLQLGAFSSPQAAAQFIRQEGIPAPAHVYALRKSSATQYLVLQGVYADRTAAEPMKRKFARHKPWLRQFGDLR